MPNKKKQFSSFFLVAVDSPTLSPPEMENDPLPLLNRKQGTCCVINKEWLWVFTKIWFTMLSQNKYIWYVLNITYSVEIGRCKCMNEQRIQGPHRSLSSIGHDSD